MNNEEIINRQIDESNEKLERKYGDTTDRCILKSFTSEEKEIIWDWMHYQQLYSLKEGYLRAKKDFKKKSKIII